jgi:hypothetical protein
VDAEGDELEAGDIGDIGPEADGESTALENSAPESTAAENTALENTALENTALENTALEPAHHFSLLQPAERYPSPEGHVSEPARDDRVAQDTGAAPDDNSAGEPRLSPHTPPSGETDR